MNPNSPNKSICIVQNETEEAGADLDFFPEKRNLNILHCFKYKPNFYRGEVQKDSEKSDFPKIG